MPNKTISPVCQLKIRDNNKIYKEEKEDPLLVVFKNKSKWSDLIIINENSKIQSRQLLNV